MFERLTDRARRVLVLAQEEARLLGHPFIGTEHMLLGLIHEGEGVAALVLREHTNLDELRDLLYVTADPVASEPQSSSTPPFTPRAKKVLEFALREALQLGHNYIGTEHILLGLIREGGGTAAKVLADLDLGLPELRREVIQRLNGYKTEPVEVEVKESVAALSAGPEQPFTDEEVEAIALLGALTVDQVRSVAWLTALKLAKMRSRM